MKTYKLFTFVAGERLLSKHPDAEARGIVEAEKLANELLEAYIHEYPCDTFVACVEEEWDLHCNNYLCWQEDYYGERYWKMMINGYWCPVGMRLLTDDEEEDLDLLREEKDLHVWDLDEEQLKKLRSEISINSIFYSDFNNSFEIDCHEVSNYADGYLEHLRECEYEDTPQEFAEYCMSVEVA